MKPRRPGPGKAADAAAAPPGLAGLRQAWNAQQKERERRQQAERERQAREQAAERAAERERQLFRHSVGPVQPMADPGRVDPQQQAQARRPSPHPRSREQDEQAVLREALSDEFDVASLLETDADLAFRRPGISDDVLQRLRRGHWSIRAQIDLHGLRSDEARERLAEFIRESARNGQRCVRVVHGKGLGSPGRVPVLKDKVRRWLVQKAEVLAFVQARADEGGAGALVVLLQDPQRRPA